MSFKLVGGKMGCNGHVVVCVVGRGGRENVGYIFVMPRKLIDLRLELVHA